MLKVYESFSEIAEDFCDGDHWTHSLSDHLPEDCHSWQHGIEEFANWLDAVGLKLAANPQHYKALWEDIRTHKPKTVSRHPKKAEADLSKAVENQEREL